jgi:hypothetical protein
LNAGIEVLEPKQAGLGRVGDRRHAIDRDARHVMTTTGVLAHGDSKDYR